MASRCAHNAEIVGSIPTPATIFKELMFSIIFASVFSTVGAFLVRAFYAFAVYHVFSYIGFDPKMSLKAFVAMCLLIDQFFFLLTKNLITFTIRDGNGVPMDQISNYFNVDLELDTNNSTEEDNKNANQN